MNKILISFALVAIVLSGCATANKISRVQIGMTEENVVQTIGKPASTSAKGDTKYLNYSLSETSDDAFYGRTRAYFVRLVNGIVDSYGRLGDFDSTKDPTVKIKSEGNINTQSDVKISNRSDLYTELKKLKQLKDDDLISEEEFEKEKKELLDKY